jgi:hypothetical protein
VRCYHCLNHFDASEKAITLSCPRCYQRVEVRDVIVRDEMRAKVVQTCGLVIIEKKGRLRAEAVEACEGVEVLGELDAHCVSHAHVFIGAKATWRGDCTAPMIVMEPGAKVLGGRFEIRRN